MKFNWGHGIFTFIVIFLLSTAFVVYKGFQEKNALVEEEYYPKGLEYQKQINRIANADSMVEKITLLQKDGNIVISYPVSFSGKKLEGTLFFYRPSDDAGDYKESMICDNTMQQRVTTARLLPGKYVVKLTWKVDGKEFYQEESVNIDHR
jgi:hypothetical protein